MFINSDGNLQTYPLATWQGYLTEWIRATASESTNTHQIAYNVNGSGTNRGSAMADTKLDGSGNYQTRQALMTIGHRSFRMVRQQRRKHTTLKLQKHRVNNGRI